MGYTSGGKVQFSLKIFNILDHAAHVVYHSHNFPESAEMRRLKAM